MVSWIWPLETSGNQFVSTFVIFCSFYLNILLRFPQEISPVFVPLRGCAVLGFKYVFFVYLEWALFHSGSVGFVPFADAILSVESPCYLLGVARRMQPLVFQKVSLHLCVQAHIKPTYIKLFNVYVNVGLCLLYILVRFYAGSTSNLKYDWDVCNTANLYICIN